MKKSLTKKRETEKSRHLTLNRETIKLLEGPKLLENARGGTYQVYEQTTTVEMTGCT